MTKIKPIALTLYYLAIGYFLLNAVQIMGLSYYHLDQWLQSMHWLGR